MPWEREGRAPLPDLGEEGQDGAHVGAWTGISFFPCYIFSLVSRVLVCWGCRNEVPKLSAFNNRSVLSPSSGAVRLGSRRQLGWLLLRPVRRMVPCLSPGFWRLAGTLLRSWLRLHPPDLCLQPHVSSWSPCVCVCVQVSSFYKDTSHIALKPTLLQCDLIFIYPFPNKGTF